MAHNDSIYQKLEQELGISLSPVQDHERFPLLRSKLKPGTSFTIFGAGGAGQKLATYLREKGAVVSRFLDNNPKLDGTELDGVGVHRPETLGTDALKGETILIGSMYFAEISRQLTNQFGLVSFRDFFTPHLFLFEVNIMGHGYNAEMLDHMNEYWQDILKTSELWEDAPSRKQFFRYLYLRLYYLTPERIDSQILSLTSKEPMEIKDDMLDQPWFNQLQDPLRTAFLEMMEKETYNYGPNNEIAVSPGDQVVDGGAWLGDSALIFCRDVGPSGKVWAFEPQAEQGDALRKLAETLPFGDRIHLEPAGLWSSSGTIRFNDSNDYHGSGSYASVHGSIEIPVLALDDFLDGKRIDFIKLDIEGSELDALKGAEKTIRKWKPKLAICLYHQPSDLHRIPLYLSSLNLGYRFYFEHNSSMPTDAILFAATERTGLDGP